MRLYDYDFGAKDDLLSTVNFSINDIKRGKYKNPVWVNMYGCNIHKTSDKYKKIINNNPALANYWCGRIHVAIEIVDEE